MNYKLVFYQEGDLTIIDTCDNKTAKSNFLKEDINQIRLRYPKAVIVPFEWAIEQINEAAKEKFRLLIPIEITKERYSEMLECLPPVQWTRSDDGESFKMAERTFGDITACFVKKNDKFFEMMGRVSTPHTQLLSCCKSN